MLLNYALIYKHINCSATSKYEARLGSGFKAEDRSFQLVDFGFYLTQWLVMNIGACLTNSVAVALLLFSGCNSKDPVAPPTTAEWRSENFDISATLGNGWQKAHVNSLGDTFDRAGDEDCFPLEVPPLGLLGLLSNKPTPHIEATLTIQSPPLPHVASLASQAT
ncbi:MAG: hypothetical protein ACR2NK_19215 [Mariniblastus sp.]